MQPVNGRRPAAVEGIDFRPLPPIGPQPFVLVTFGLPETGRLMIHWPPAESGLTMTTQQKLVLAGRCRRWGSGQHPYDPVFEAGRWEQVVGQPEPPITLSRVPTGAAWLLGVFASPAHLEWAVQTSPEFREEHHDVTAGYLTVLANHEVVREIADGGSRLYVPR
jgi:hypothetical protein